jgi:uncharacterized protein
MKKLLSVALAALALAATLGAGRTAAGAVPPAPERHVTDLAGVLPPAVLDALDGQLEAFERETSHQLVVWIAPRVPEGTTPEELGADAIRSWGVGQAAKDNGLVFFVFTQDRVTRIATGYGLEGAVPDAIAKRIQVEITSPHFARGDFATGVQLGVDALIKATRGELPAPRSPSLAEEYGWHVRWFVAVPLGLLLLIGLARRVPRGWVAGLAVIGTLVNVAAYFAPFVPTWFVLLFLFPVPIHMLDRVKYGWRWAPNRWSNMDSGGSGGSGSSFGGSGGFDSSDSSSSSGSSGFSGGGGDSGGGGASDRF